jgi:hypothetical protein
MVPRLLSFGWARKSPVSVERYSNLLSDALGRAANYRPSDVVAREVGLREGVEPTLEMAQKLVQETKEEFDAYQDSVIVLHGIRPEPKELLDLHMRAVAFLRGVVEWKGRAASVLVALGNGNYQEAAKFQREGHHWIGVTQKAHGDLVKELHRVKVNHPELYKALRIPPEVLQELSLQ